MKLQERSVLFRNRDVVKKKLKPGKKSNLLTRLRDRNLDLSLPLTKALVLHWLPRDSMFRDPKILDPILVTLGYNETGLHPPTFSPGATTAQGTFQLLPSSLRRIKAKYQSALQAGAVPPTIAGIINRLSPINSYYTVIPYVAKFLVDQLSITPKFIKRAGLSPSLINVTNPHVIKIWESLNSATPLSMDKAAMFIQTILHIEGPGFMNKNSPFHYPDRVANDLSTYLVVKNLPSLIQTL
jgi:hypothetical protein